MCGFRSLRTRARLTRQRRGKWSSQLQQQGGDGQRGLARPTSRRAGTPDSVAFRTRLRHIPDDGGQRGRDA